MRRLPSKPPYTVYLGNLSYECSEDDIHQLFDRKKLRVGCTFSLVYVLPWLCFLQAQSVRLPLESGTQRLRGFGYAEFDNINDLKEALLLKGEVRGVVCCISSHLRCVLSTVQQLLNRPVQIDIADGKGGGASGEGCGLAGSVWSYCLRFR